MLGGYPTQDVLFALGLVLAFGIGFIGGNQR